MRHDGASDLGRAVAAAKHATWGARATPVGRGRGAPPASQLPAATIAAYADGRKILGGLQTTVKIRSISAVFIVSGAIDWPIRWMKRTPKPVRSSVRQLPDALAGLLLCSTVHALPSHLEVSQLYHRQWTVLDGAPTGIESLAQTRDGYLWMGTQPEGLPPSTVHGFTRDPSGTMWVGTSRRLLRLENGAWVKAGGLEGADRRRARGPSS